MDKRLWNESTFNFNCIHRFKTNITIFIQKSSKHWKLCQWLICVKHGFPHIMVINFIIIVNNTLRFMTKDDVYAEFVRWVRFNFFTSHANLIWRTLYYHWKHLGILHHFVLVNARNHEIDIYSENKTSISDIIKKRKFDRRKSYLINGWFLHIEIRTAPTRLNTICMEHADTREVLYSTPFVLFLSFLFLCYCYRF